MPVVGQRDPAHITAVLEKWLAARLGVGRVEVRDLVVPQTSGFSNETFLLGARWSEDPGAVPSVWRGQRNTAARSPELDRMEQQSLPMKPLGEHSAGPVAKVLGAEPDPAALGGPFFVMERREGRVRGDPPPYTLEGFV